ncbi:MAG TPA: hypothetical protein VII92_04400 [Anaerolineae bacterium]
MTKQTKIELVQINAALAAENAALRKEVADFEMAADLAASMLSRATARIHALEAQAPRTKRPLEQWQVDRAQAMAAARALAMANHTVVKV